jgi:small-conductance mechanosensitive channel
MLKIFFKKILYPAIALVLLIWGKFFFAKLNWNPVWVNVEDVSLITDILIIFALAWVMISLVSFGKFILLSKNDLTAEDNLKARKILTQFNLIQKLINITIIIVAISMVLMNFENIKNFGISLLASAGIAGIIIGFAAQKLLATVIAGLQIAFTQPIRLDDVVIVENEWGWIEEITLTFVVVRIWDKRRLVVPTTFFIDKPFQNWTRTSADILGTVYIYTDYTLPIDRIREKLNEIVSQDKYWDGQTCVLQVTNATEKTMELRALVSAKNSPAAWELRVNTREKLIRFLQETYPDSLPKTRIELHQKLT